MITSLPSQLFGILAIILLGYLLVNIFLPKNNFFEKVALGFLVGFGVFTFALFLANWLWGIPFDILSCGLILLFLIFSVILINLSRSNKFWIVGNIFTKLHIYLIEMRHNPVGKIIIFFILAFIPVSILISDLYWPVWQWDAIALYDYRARNMVLFKSIVLSFNVNDSAYPLLTSIGHGIVYLLGGTNPQYLYFLFFLSIALIYYFFLRRFLERTYAAISTLFVMSLPMMYRHAQFALSDLPQSAYLISGFLYLALGLSSNKKSYIYVSSILFSLSGWVRNEPFWIVAFIILVIFSFRRRWFLLDGIFFTLSYAVSRVWLYFVNTVSDNALAYNHAPAKVFAANFSTFINPVFWLVPITFVFKNAILPTLPVYIALVILLLLHRRTIVKIVVVISVEILGIILIILAGSSYYAVTSSQWNALYSSLQRLMIFLDVLAMANVSLLLFPWSINKKKN